ncbi:hypothetical protein DK419_13030 [Methylobacterium terrae]|uniref:Uncharacterized protein n=2 Tax=Methylobacterium terrae TaxID=2202827 RepID=A0A2U8WNL8_9HYPH|nr:hypothetical protein DK419_13030 [Methylobacterium terrae]
MTISLGARGRLTGDAYIIATVTPSGTSGGTLTVVDPVAGAYNSVAFVIDTRDFNGTAPNYLIASYTQTLNALLRLTSPLTNLFTGSRQVALDKDNASAISRLLFAISGRTWGAVEQRTLTYTPTGAAQTTTETVSLRAYPDGTTPIDALLIDLATGGADLRKASATMASAPTVDLGSAPTGKVAVTGSATILSFGVGKHLERLVHIMDGGAVLTYNATSLVLPGGANITTAAGDCFHATSDGSGNWRVRSYARASGKPVIRSGSADIADASASGRIVLTGTAGQGATALGLGVGNIPTFMGAILNGAIQTRGAITAGGYVGVGFANDTGLQYWGWGLGDALGGGNSGANLKLFSYGDGGGFLSGPIVINRATSQTVLMSLAVTGGTTLGGTLQLAFYTVATLPAGTVGVVVFASNARKPGEAAGAGTGVLACYSNGAWRRLSDEAAVAA